LQGQINKRNEADFPGATPKSLHAMLAPSTRTKMEKLFPQTSLHPRICGYYVIISGLHLWETDSPPSNRISLFFAPFLIDSLPPRVELSICAQFRPPLLCTVELSVGGKTLRRFAESILRLLKIKSAEDKEVVRLAEDDRLALMIVARLRTECETPQAHSQADKIA
jgi:hypothetical protein